MVKETANEFLSVFKELPFNLTWIRCLVNARNSSSLIANCQERVAFGRFLECVGFFLWKYIKKLSSRF